MSDVDPISNPWLTVLAVAASAGGAYSGLCFADRARAAGSAAEARAWTALEAFSLGGVATWCGHVLLLAARADWLQVRHEPLPAVVAVIVPVTTALAALELLQGRAASPPSPGRWLSASFLLGGGALVGHLLALAASPQARLWALGSGRWAAAFVLVACGSGLLLRARTEGRRYPGELNPLLRGGPAAGFHAAALATAHHLTLPTAEPGGDGANAGLPQTLLVFTAFALALVVLTAALSVRGRESPGARQGAPPEEGPAALHDPPKRARH